jgi:aryl-alcohol dehydrogenase-like predicted oxidoreductase
MAIRMIRQINRRDFVALAGGLLLSTKAAAQTETPVLTRPIPGSGERIPAVGLGTAYVFDQNNGSTRSKADAVVRALVKNGGRLIDTASTYGDAESVLGEVIATGSLRDKVFIATKLEAPDAGELKRSLVRLKTEKVDLLQLHNVRSKQQSLQRFREWKNRGICRYIGITSTFHSDYGAVEAVIEREKPDFVQIDYSLDNRAAEKTILPMAADIKAGVLTAQPYGNGRLFKVVHGRELPEWARAFAGSWGQFFLKFLLADSRVTAVIPGTGDSGHMIDNAGAMRGPLPDPDQRRRMIAFVESL